MTFARFLTQHLHRHIRWLLIGGFLLYSLVFGWIVRQHALQQLRLAVALLDQRTTELLPHVQTAIPPIESRTRTALHRMTITPLLQARLREWWYLLHYYQPFISGLRIDSYAIYDAGGSLRFLGSADNTGQAYDPEFPLVTWAISTQDRILDNTPLSALHSEMIPGFRPPEPQQFPDSSLGRWHEHDAMYELLFPIHDRDRRLGTLVLHFDGQRWLDDIARKTHTTWRILSPGDSDRASFRLPFSSDLDLSLSAYALRAALPIGTSTLLIQVPLLRELWPFAVALGVLSLFSLAWIGLGYWSNTRLAEHITQPLQRLSEHIQHIQIWSKTSQLIFENDAFEIKELNAIQQAINDLTDALNDSQRQQKQNLTSLRQSEQIASRSHAELERILEEYTDGVSIIVQGVLVYLNDKAADLLGMGKDDAQGHTLAEFLSFDSQGVLADILDILERGEFLNGHAETRRWENTELHQWFQGEFRHIDWHGQAALLIITRDITGDVLRRQLEQAERDALHTALDSRQDLCQLTGKTPGIRHVRQILYRVAPTSLPVLIMGETGTGKELAARCVHRLSAVSAGPFVAVNCGAVPDNLFESEFFGYKKGAFSGADTDKPGYFQAAHGGTIFLDEIGELSPSLQVKLLRVLQEVEVTPVGDTSPVPISVRVVAATNRDLADAVEGDRFRADLYYRLTSGDVIHLPPLRERKADIPILVAEYLQPYDVIIDDDWLTGLMRHDWPGNIRELHAACERYSVSGAETQEMSHHQPPLEEKTLQEAIIELEQRMIQDALEACNGNKAQAAKRLGIHRNTLVKKISTHHNKSSV